MDVIQDQFPEEDKYLNKTDHFESEALPGRPSKSPWVGNEVDEDNVLEHLQHYSASPIQKWSPSLEVQNNVRVISYRIRYLSRHNHLWQLIYASPSTAIDALQ